ncbi:STM4014 family protein [Actinoplanes regularis]|uniref:ATP-grasp domain-containing protein n=1 Tax=Actinoplanes regularis TaxID=52697 RepID=A0A239D3U9_9ACTN|nr:STM4014 family protein [Actinoplanes regularis]GIE88424.1 hypothetical protein Are01nite_49040 [Actinoplanes regularis]SNS26909.1 hypothetical protein SAMN06264365_112244 [Actinoplanes regularis]
MRLAVVGNPENRRVAQFVAAVERAGLRTPEIFPWRDVLLSGRVPGPGSLVRIDSPGENAEVDRLLRALGGDLAAEPAEHGEIIGGAAAFAGLRQALGTVAAGGGTLLNQPADILAMTAKPRCHAVLSAAGIPVPPALKDGGIGTPAAKEGATGIPSLEDGTTGIPTLKDGATGTPAAKEGGTAVPASEDGATGVPAWEDGSGRASPGPVDSYLALRTAMRTAGWNRVFVKPAYGSSASGVLALAVGTGRRILAVTSVELSQGRIFNNLRVRRYDDEESIAAIVDRLAGDGLHVERWYPKAALDGRVLDLRVVVIAGRARHVVVRTSRSPMTNLHLGNARGDVAAVRAAAGERAWDAAMRTCERAAACFPRTLHAGVDLMFRTGWREHAVAEVNAFGDLLPGVLSADGLDTYGAQVAAVLTGWPGADARHDPASG